MNHVVIIGFMGSGKTRVGKQLSKDLGLPFVDLEKIITKRMNLSAREIFERFGEPYYRALETLALKQLIQDSERKVISLGAGLPLQEQNEKYLRELGTVVYLKGSLATLKKRLEGSKKDPMLDGEDRDDKIKKLLKQRDPVYQKFADIQVTTGEVPFEELIKEIEEKLSTYEKNGSEHKTKEDNKMISAGDFRNGVTIEIEGNVCQIVEFQHVKPGKGAAFVRTKYKNIITGAVLEKSFRPTEKFPQARIDRVDMSYLYNDGDLYNFMNTETYDQVALTKEQVGDSLKFVKENEVVKVCSWNGNVYAIEPPLFVELEVIETEPGFAGNTAQGATKPATVETGAQVMVPLFVNQGDKLKIDTRTGEYLSRV